MRWAWCALTLLGWATLQSSARADEAVFRRTNAAGHTVYTNIGNVAVGGVPLEALDLPQLQRLDVTQLPSSDLARLDARIEEALASTQGGARCSAIRSASRAAFREVVWQEHRRELFLALGLFVFSAMLGFAVQNQALRALLPVAPFVGALFLGYVAVTRSEEARALLHGGLRACSADLPEREPNSPSRTQERLSSAVDIKARIDQVFQQREQRMETLIERTVR